MPDTFPLRHVAFDAIRQNGDSDDTFRVQPGGQFQLGNTTFEMTSPTVDLSVSHFNGQAKTAGQTVDVEIGCDSFFLNKLYIKMNVDDQPAGPDTWSQVMFGKAFGELKTQQRKLITEARQYRESEKSNGKAEEATGDDSAPPKPEADEPSTGLPAEKSDDSGGTRPDHPPPLNVPVGSKSLTHVD